MLPPALAQPGKTIEYWARLNPTAPSVLHHAFPTGRVPLLNLCLKPVLDSREIDFGLPIDNARLSDWERSILATNYMVRMGCDLMLAELAILRGTCLRLAWVAAVEIDGVAKEAWVQKIPSRVPPAILTRAIDCGE